MNSSPRPLRVVLPALALAVLTVSLGWALVLAQRAPAANRPASGHENEPTRRVLFIGNSLTRGNDLPGMLEALAAASADGPRIRAATVLRDGASLDDHWSSREAQRRIAEGGWDLVVLQQGPSSLPESRRQLLASVRRYDQAIRRAGGRPALYMVWPSRARSGDFERVCESYRLAAEEVEGVLFPVGEAWRAAWRRDPDLPLYGRDDFHPSPAGTYLAALVMYAVIADRSPLELPGPSELAAPSLRALKLDEAQIRALKEAAAEAVGKLAQVPGGAATAPAGAPKSEPPNGAGDITPPPAALGLDPFYAKHISAGGLPVVSSKKVPDAALLEAANLVNRMLASRPDVRDALVAARVRVAVMADDEVTTDVPEHRDLAPKAYWDRRARGLGATPERPATSCGEENLLGYDDDPYLGESILIHEFAHTIHQIGLAAVDPGFDARLKGLYDAAMKAGLWQKTYAAENHGEYWAEGVQAYFDANLTADPTNGIHNHVGTRTALMEYDPALAKLIGEVFRDKQWRWRPTGAHRQRRAAP